LPIEINLDQFKKLLDSEAPSFPGENGNMPGVKRAAANSFAKSFKDTIFGTGMTILIFLVCTFAGTLAANDAIGRSVFIRIIFFIYASIPIFSPFVFIYYIYRYFNGLRPKIYAYLPLIPNGNYNLILSYLLAPFSYIPDYLPNSKIHVQTKIYEIIASGFVWKEEG
jgi:ABC-type sugar transport system permease subunit